MEIKKPYNYLGEIFIMKFDDNYPENMSISDELRMSHSYINANPEGFKVGNTRNGGTFDDVYEALDFACSQIISSRCFSIGFCELFDVPYQPGYENVYESNLWDEDEDMTPIQRVQVMTTPASDEVTGG